MYAKSMIGSTLNKRGKSGSVPSPFVMLLTSNQSSRQVSSLHWVKIDMKTPALQLQYSED